MKKVLLSDLYCPKLLLDGKIVSFKSSYSYLQSPVDKYPIYDGVPDLRLKNDRSYTPYDTVLSSHKESHIMLIQKNIL